MADFIVGSPAREGDFWFRNEFIKNLWNSIKKHNVLLIAPRRIGKTTVMYNMLDKPKDNWLVIHLNVEELKSPGDFFITLVDAIHEHQPEYLRRTLAKSSDFLKGIFSRIDKIEAYEFKIELRKSGDLRKNWEERATQLMDRVFASGEKILFIIDEFPDMLNGILGNSPDAFETFLHWFRIIREKSLNYDVRWLIGGSVNLIVSLDKQGKVKLVNDLKPEILVPFSADEVREFVTRMFKKNRVLFDDTVIPRILELLGSPIPYFLQMLTQELYRKWKRNRAEPLSADTVTEVFNKTLLGEMARDKLLHYRSRIDIHYLPEEREAACYLLNKLSLSEDGISRNTLFNLYRQVEEKKSGGRTGHILDQSFQRLLLYLQSDFYIEEIRDGYYDFTSRLLKTWWKKYYGYELGGN
jgi:hypothetical protein